MFTKKDPEEPKTEEGTEERALSWRDPLGPSLTAPFPPLRRFMEDMERMFEDFGRGLPTPSFWRLPEMGKFAWAPELEVFEKKGMLMVRADLPGLTKDDVKVEIRENELTIQGERKTEHEEKKEGYYRSERRYGTFNRTVRLPEGVKVDKAKATFENGVLEVTLPVPAREEPKVHKVAIEGVKAKKVQAA